MECTNIYIGMYLMYVPTKHNTDIFYISTSGYRKFIQSRALRLRQDWASEHRTAQVHEQLNWGACNGNYFWSLSLSLSSCSGYFWSWSQRPSKRIFWSCGSLFILESLRCSASSAHATWYWYDSRVIGYRIVEVFVLFLFGLSYLLREKRKKLPTYPMGIERKLPPAFAIFLKSAMGED